MSGHLNQDLVTALITVAEMPAVRRAPSDRAAAIGQHFPHALDQLRSEVLTRALSNFRGATNRPCCLVDDADFVALRFGDGEQSVDIDLSNTNPARFNKTFSALIQDHWKMCVLGSIDQTQSSLTAGLQLDKRFAQTSGELGVTSESAEDILRMILIGAGIQRDLINMSADSLLTPEANDKINTVVSPYINRKLLSLAGTHSGLLTWRDLLPIAKSEDGIRQAIAEFSGLAPLNYPIEAFRTPDPRTTKKQIDAIATLVRESETARRLLAAESPRYLFRLLHSYHSTNPARESLANVFARSVVNGILPHPVILTNRVLNDWAVSAPGRFDRIVRALHLFRSMNWAERFGLKLADFAASLSGSDFDRATDLHAFCLEQCVTSRRQKRIAERDRRLNAALSPIINPIAWGDQIFQLTSARANNGILYLCFESPKYSLDLEYDAKCARFSHSPRTSALPRPPIGPTDFKSFTDELSKQVKEIGLTRPTLAAATFGTTLPPKVPRMDFHFRFIAVTRDAAAALFHASYETDVNSGPSSLDKAIDQGTAEIVAGAAALLHNPDYSRSAAERTMDRAISTLDPLIVAALLECRCPLTTEQHSRIQAMRYFQENFPASALARQLWLQTSLSGSQASYAIRLCPDVL